MKYTISELQTRYGLSRAGIYNRIKALNLKPISRGVMSSETVDKLDDLDKYLKNNPGASLSDLPKNAEVITTTKLDLSSGAVDKVDNFDATVELIESIARHLVNRDPLIKYKALDYAVRNQLLLPSSKIKELIGVNPCNYGNEFKRGNFIFKKQGKIGKQIAWEINDA